MTNQLINRFVKTYKTIDNRKCYANEAVFLANPTYYFF